MTDFELKSLAFQKWDLIINLTLATSTLLLAVVALWGERLRQWWNRPKLQLSLSAPNLTNDNSGKKIWCYYVYIKNNRISSPAENVEVRLTRLYFMGPDNSWQEYHFSGPVQVMWRSPEPQKRTIGPDTHATFAYLREEEDAAHLQLYWMPNNLKKVAQISPNKSVKLRFKAVSNTAESNELAIVVSWDGEWAEGRDEMARHFVVKEISP